MNIGVTTWIEYGIAFIVSILIVNRLVDAYFAKYVTKSAIKDESEEQVEEIKEVDVVPHIPPPPQLYEVYTPAIFSKQRTKELYRYLTFSSRYFFDEPWLGTLAEILTLLESMRV